MIPAAARALERFFGGAFAPAAGLLRAAAWLALAVLVAAAVSRALRAARGRRLGWETATVVRCPVCGGLAADPTHPVCPSGHAVQFPPGSALRELERRERGSGGDSLGGRLVAAAAVSAAFAVLGAAAARPWRIADAAAPPLAAIAGAGGYLFLVVALALGDRALSPAPRRGLDRAISAAAAALLVMPALAGLALARAADPPLPRTIGSLWTTPTALYVSAGGKAWRAGPAAAEAEADVVSARSALFGLSWTGLARVRTGTTESPWRGSGGFAARMLDRHGPRPGGTVLAVDRRRLPVSTPPNVKIRILRSADGIAFEADR